ncbi:hypothetical protein B9N66_08115 [Campylobacter concisus]|uniref:toxin-antitoxin system YwqK family antitoxin n=1 Tax=Campylobacter concisus TaxID=199 RepID=UPI000B3D6321|nr:hypothetical protein [Campylobacter concisus]OUT08242.1 hypothetical protein B9N66_08115 [Campylobacter concisus]
MKKTVLLIFIAILSLKATDKICETKLDMIEGCLLKEYENERLKADIPYKNNKINGVVREYFLSNGRLNIEKHVTDDVLNGELKVWYENGQLMEAINYNNGKVFDGHYKIFYDNGKLKGETWFKDSHKTKEKYYKKDGKLSVTMNYKDGKFIGGLCERDKIKIPANTNDFVEYSLEQLSTMCENDFLF